jgi:hypothetical protein
MRHFFLTSGLVCSTLLLTGAMDRQALSSATPRDDPFLPAGAETPAGTLLPQMLTSLGGDRLHWLETKVRQRMFGDEPFEAEGRYLLAPGQRMRLELRIKTEGNRARILAVSDGRQLWQGRWLGGDAEPPVVEPLPPAHPQQARARAGFLEARGLGGPLCLLRQIHQSLQAPTQQPGTWHGRPAIRVSGAWNTPEDMLQTLPTDLRARRCNIFLDAKTLWPYRIEWIGSPQPGNYPVLLLQMDFQDPVLNQPRVRPGYDEAFRVPRG